MNQADHLHDAESHVSILNDASEDGLDYTHQLQFISKKAHITDEELATIAKLHKFQAQKASVDMIMTTKEIK